MMKVLNLYAGIGGNRKLWDGVTVTAVESNPQIAEVYKSLYPNDVVIVGDAHQYLLEHYKEFDFVWSSPPCPSHSKQNLQLIPRGISIRYPDMGLYQEIIFLDKFFKGVYVVENVKPYYHPLIAPSFEADRHLFWSNLIIGHFSISRSHNVSRATVSELQYFHGIYLPDGVKDKRKLLRNAVHPLLGQHIFNCANNR